MRIWGACTFRNISSGCFQRQSGQKQRAEKKKSSLIIRPTPEIHRLALPPSFLFQFHLPSFTLEKKLFTQRFSKATKLKLTVNRWRVPVTSQKEWREVYLKKLRRGVYTVWLWGDGMCFLPRVSHTCSLNCVHFQSEKQHLKTALAVSDDVTTLNRITVN